MTNELTVIEKGWQLDSFKMELCYNINDYVVSAATEDEAKRKLFMLESVYKMRLSTGELLTLDNIPLIECPEADIVMCCGEPVRRNRVREFEENKAIEQSRNALRNYPGITHCYISKGGSYYRPDYKGYTEHRYLAGVYTKEDAISSCKDVRYTNIMPIDIEEHNAYLSGIIAEIQSRIIIK